jgi:hypothetical protein
LHDQTGEMTCNAQNTSTARDGWRRGSGFVPDLKEHEIAVWPSTRKAARNYDTYETAASRDARDGARVAEAHQL